MKKLLAVLIVGVSLYACGPSSDTTTDNPGNISSSPTSDPATSDSTGAVKEAEVPTVPTDSTSVPTVPTVPTDSTSKIPDSTSNP